MNIILYGIPADTAELIAGRYDLELIHSIEEIGTCGALLPVPKITAPRQLLALYNALMRHEDAIDAVIICGSETCGAAGTICYGAPPGKIFTLCGDPGGEELEAECYSGCSMPSSRKPTGSTSETTYSRKNERDSIFKFFPARICSDLFRLCKKSAGKNFHNRLSPRNRPCS